MRDRLCCGGAQSTLLIGADYYEDENSRQQLFVDGKVPIGVGDDTIIENAIIDKNARIGKNCIIVNKQGVDEADHPKDGYYIRSGIVCIIRNAVIPDGTHI